jgi:hypothetical protein
VSGGLEIGIETRPLERLDCDVLVVGLFEDDRPLRGGAARLDWRLCGQVSELVIEGRISGASGEAVLLASPGSVRAPRVLVLGLGDRRRFTLATARDVMHDALRRCIDLGVRRIAAAPLGMVSDDFARHAESVVQGLIDALSPETDGGIELLVALPSSHAETAERALETALLGRSESGLCLRSRARERAQPPSGPRAPRGITPPPS